MIKHIHVLSRRSMTEMFRRREFPPNAIFISITGTDQRSLFPLRTKGLLALKFDDSTPTNSEEWEVPFSEEQAHQVVEFLLKHHGNVADDCVLYVNCQAGIARSGAVGEFAQRLAGIPYDSFRKANPHVRPNPYVLMLLMRELRERGLA